MESRALKTSPYVYCKSLFSVNPPPPLKKNFLNKTKNGIKNKVNMQIQANSLAR